MPLAKSPVIVYYSSMKLLTVGNTKTVKGEAKGYRTFILHLAPAKLSGYNVCPMASKGCAAACLNTAGRGRFTKTQAARIRKTKLFFEDRDTFMVMLVKDIRAAIRNADRENLIPVFRLNGTSDIRWETVTVGTKVNSTFMADNIMALFPTVQFYDYTKLANRGKLPANYHLTFSRSETNEISVLDWLGMGGNIAAVFAHLPETWNGYKVVSGDETDLRFLDGDNVIVGLTAKGAAKKDASGFVVTV